DQSYFLWDLTPEQLSAARFPVGALAKKEVRELARSAGLPTADKEESQEICFVPRGDRAGDFVREHAPGMGLALPTLPGKIEGSSGQPLGEHSGHYRFTVGQRRGLGVAAPGRLYVLAVDADANRVVVGAEGELLVGEARVEEMRFPSGAPDGPFHARVRVRHRGVETPATVVPAAGGSGRVVFEEPVRAVAPGQSCVFYDGDVVVGGGVIRGAERPPGARRPRYSAVNLIGDRKDP
ncbi:MAG: aminomethyltransferase beta-barrel domain-containing protein, partial [Acidobacteriota bacterium]